MKKKQLAEDEHYNDNNNNKNNNDNKWTGENRLKVKKNISVTTRGQHLTIINRKPTNR